MSDQRLRIRNFSGGLSDDDKFGQANSFSKAVGLNFRTYIGKLNLLKRLQKDIDSVTGSPSPLVNTTLSDAIRVPNGNVYIAGGQKLIKRVPGANGAAGTYTDVTSDISGMEAYDLDYNATLDAMFLYGSHDISQYSPMLGTPAGEGIKFTDITFLTQDASGGTYTLPTSISEAAGDKFPFTADHDGLRGVVVDVNTKGTGQWNITLHDAANRVVATGFVVNAAMPASGSKTITWTSNPNDTYNGQNARTQLGHDYHVHLTVSTGTSKITSSASNDLLTAKLSLTAVRLLDSKYHHRIIQFGAATYFCNERYLGKWEILDLSVNSTSGFDPYALVFPPGYVSCGVALYSEYIATACSVDGVSGIILFWDTASSTFNFTLPVPQGVPEGLFAADNALFWIARGVLYTWAGNGIKQVYRFPGVNEFAAGAGGDAPLVDDYLAAPRFAMASRRGLLQVGFPAATANANVEIGIYSFGSMKSSMPNAISKDYILSTGTTTTKFLTNSSPDTPVTGIKFVKDFGTDMLVGWNDGITATTSKNGIDYINDSSPVATAASWRSFWFDNGDPDIEKTPMAIKVTFRTLASGCTVTPVVEYDRSGTEITGTQNIDGAASTIQGVAGDVDVVFPLDSTNGFYEARFGFDLASSSGNDIDITSITFKFDDGRDNKQATESSRG